jgi:hypothetical protein
MTAEKGRERQRKAGKGRVKQKKAGKRFFTIENTKGTEALHGYAFYRF